MGAEVSYDFGEKGVGHEVAACHAKYGKDGIVGDSGPIKVR